jgi:hypothetical protein
MVDLKASSAGVSFFFRCRASPRAPGAESLRDGAGLVAGMMAEVDENVDDAAGSGSRGAGSGARDCRWAHWREARSCLALR